PNDERHMRIFSLEDKNGLEDGPFEPGDDDVAELPSFDEALEAIQNDTLEPASLLGFSDISRNEARQLAQVWATLPDESRTTIADHVNALGDDDILLDFMRFFRVLLDD